MSKRTNDYGWREQQLEKLPPVAERWNFLPQEEYEQLPTAPWFDLQGRIIPNHPELPEHLKNLAPTPPDIVQRVIRRTQRSRRRDQRQKALEAPLPQPPTPILHAHEDFYPDYPEDWIDVTEEAHHDYLLPTHITNVPSRTTYDLANTNGMTMQNVPDHIRQAALAVHSVGTELHEHTRTVHGIKDLLLAQNRDVHVLVLKKLVNGENIDQDIFPEDVRAFARNYFKQKKELLFLNSNGVLCVKYPPAQRPLNERPCMIVMSQLYQHEILFRAHDGMGHQGIGKVVARIQERHTWPLIRRTVGEYVSQCLTCQQVRDKPGDVRFHLKNIQSGYFNELVQYDHMKLCPTDDGNTGILVIIDHFSKFAEVVLCSHDEYDAITTSRLLLQKWFARHGTPTRMQSDNAPNLTAEVSNETLTTYSPVPLCATMDGVDVKFEACVVVDVFPPGICLGPQELKCYNINHQEPTGEARIDERASLVVSFVVPHAAPIPLRGLVDTGSGVSILTFSAFNRVAARTGTVLKPYQIDLYAANGKTIKTFGLAEQIRFQLGGYELETNIVVVDDAMGVEDFLLGRNFLRSYQVLVDLTSMKIVVRAPVKPVWHQVHAQVGDTSLATLDALDSDLVLQPFERTVVEAKLITNTLEPLIFQSVALNAAIADASLHNVVFLEDSVATVSESGFGWRKQQLEKLPPVAERWNFLSQEEYEQLPTAPWFDLQGRIIPNHPELPEHLKNLAPTPPDIVQRVIRRTQRSRRRDQRQKALEAPLPQPPTPILHAHEDFYPDYPEDWIDVTEEAHHDYLLPTHITNVPSRTTYDLANTNGMTMQNVPDHIRQAALAVHSVGTELHEHTHTVHGIKDLLLAQNRDVHVLVLKKLVNGENIDQDIFPEDVRAFARNYFKQKKELLFLNSNGVLCVKYPPAQRPLNERPCMIVMSQLYQHEILFRAHDGMGHQGIGKVVARIQERHTWPGIRRTVGEYVSQCLTCQQVRDKPGDVRFHLKNIQSGYFNELVQYDHMKLCPTDDGNTGILVIIDHFSKFAEVVLCSHDEYDAITTSRLLLQKWFARHGTPTRMQSDNAPNLTAEVSNELMKASQVTKVTSTAGHPRTQGLVKRQNRTLLTLLRVFCS